MRLPHHLVRTPHGLLHYRQVVPIDLRGLFGLRVIKRSLHTRDPSVAQLRAYALSTYVGISFNRARRLLVTHKDDKPLPELDIDGPSSPSISLPIKSKRPMPGSRSRPTAATRTTNTRWKRFVPWCRGGGACGCLDRSGPRGAARAEFGWRRISIRRLLTAALVKFNTDRGLGSVTDRRSLMKQWSGSAA